MLYDIDGIGIVVKRKSAVDIEIGVERAGAEEDLRRRGEIVFASSRECQVSVAVILGASRGCGETVRVDALGGDRNVAAVVGGVASGIGAAKGILGAVFHASALGEAGLGRFFGLDVDDTGNSVAAVQRALRALHQLDA